MKERISINEISKVLKKAFKHKDIISLSDSAVVFYDLDFLNDRLRKLKQLFPENTVKSFGKLFRIDGC